MRGRHIQAGLLFVAVCLLIGLGLAMYTMNSRDAVASNSTAIAANETMPGAAAAEDTVPDVVEARAPDFVVTSQLRANPPAWEDLGVGPDAIVLCKGAKAHLLNSSKTRINLNVVVAESDDSQPLGTAQPGQTISFGSGDTGTWNITDADKGSPLFQYEIRRCRNGKPIADEPVAEEGTQPVQTAALSPQQGRCRVSVGGTRIIDGPCYFVREDGGSFAVFETDDGSGYSAQVEIANGNVEGSWNGERGGANASHSLGSFIRKGACWGNEQADVCLWGG